MAMHTDAKRISEVSDVKPADAAKRSSIFSKLKERSEEAFSTIKEKSKAALVVTAVAITLTVSCGETTTHKDSDLEGSFNAQEETKTTRKPNTKRESKMTRWPKTTMRPKTTAIP
ncbi:MAG: hypothetical protein N3H30_02005 [Candidatus Micrarchaeota archaeon]|nr:hypothetical protein [Candidatus Micrarchaeota archaeon]